MLSDEDKARIEEEERHRLKVRAAAEAAELKSKEQEKRKQTAGGCLVFASCLFSFGFWVYHSASQAPTSPPVRDLKIDVSKTLTDIVVKSNEERTCNELLIDLNSGVLGGGYRKEFARIRKGETLTIPYPSFTNSDHRRFNLSTTDPKKVYVHCKVEGRLLQMVGQFN